jgi:hypothetical protein
MESCIAANPDWTDAAGDAEFGHADMHPFRPRAEYHALIVGNDVRRPLIPTWNQPATSRVGLPRNWGSASIADRNAGLCFSRKSAIIQSVVSAVLCGAYGVGNIATTAGVLATLSAGPVPEASRAI